MPPITWTERMCVLNPRDRRLTISVLNSIFFPLKSSLSKRIIVGSENSYLGTKIMFYYSSLMVTWAHVKIILFKRQSTRSGQLWWLVSSLSQKVWVFMCSGARERKNGGQKVSPCRERQVNIKFFFPKKSGKQPKHKEIAVYTWTVNSNGIYFQLGCSLLRLGGARKPRRYKWWGVGGYSDLWGRVATWPNEGAFHLNAFLNVFWWWCFFNCQWDSDSVYCQTFL